VGQLQDLLTGGFLSILADALTLGGIIIVLLSMNARLALLTLTVLPVMTIIMAYWQRLSRRAFRRVRGAIAAVNAGLQENISGVRVIQSLSREDLNLRQFDSLNEEHLSANLQAGRVSAAVFPMVEIITSVATALVITVGGAQVLNQELSAGALIAFTLYIQRFFDPIRDLSLRYTQMQRVMAALERIYEVLDTQPEVEDAPDAVELPPLRGEVRFEKVSFAYLEGIEVLHNINLEVKPGETVAFVGPTGAGKTTMALLLGRHYDVTSGAITIDGHDLRQVTQKSLRRQMGVVPQEPFLFSGSIKDNIRYGRPEASDEEIEAAAKAVGAHDFITRLKDGYDAELQERGVNLSLGQRQLISLARAILANPAILILDEATANVDTQTEVLIQKGLRELLRGRTSFVIAHRLSTVREADHIVVMDEGCIVEEGNHRQLLAKGGLYANLYTMSFEEAKAGSKVASG